MSMTIPRELQPAAAPARPHMRSFSIRLDEFDTSKLSGAAKVRTMTPNKLATRLMRVILRDNLIEAVLDDR